LICWTSHFPLGVGFVSEVSSPSTFSSLFCDAFAQLKKLTDRDPKDQTLTLELPAPMPHMSSCCSLTGEETLEKLKEDAKLYDALVTRGLTLTTADVRYVFLYLSLSLCCLYVCVVASGLQKAVESRSSLRC
jgi:hypothetical protein